eukprot:3787712-Alexandrium_andersonii.AAC.1
MRIEWGAAALRVPDCMALPCCFVSRVKPSRPSCQKLPLRASRTSSHGEAHAGIPIGLPRGAGGGLRGPDVAPGAGAAGRRG